MNDDRAYLAGTDRPVTRDDLADGFSTDGALVVPDSVGTITATDGTTISAEGMYFAATLEVTNGGRHDGATLDAGNGELHLDGATVDNRRDRTPTWLRGGRLELDRSTVRGNGRVELETPGELSMPGTTVTSTKDSAPVTIRSTSDGIDARNADISGEGDITVWASGDVLLQDAAVDSPKDQRAITIESTGGVVDARNAMITGRGDIQIDAAGDLRFQDGSAVISKRGNLVIGLSSSGGDIRLDRATLDSGDGNSGPNNRLTATVSDGHERCSWWSCWWTRFTATGSGGHVVNVTGASFHDEQGSNDLDVTPNGATTGAPASGRVS